MYELRIVKDRAGNLYHLWHHSNKEYLGAKEIVKLHKEKVRRRFELWLATHYPELVK